MIVLTLFLPTYLCAAKRPLQKKAAKGKQQYAQLFSLLRIGKHLFFYAEKAHRIGPCMLCYAPHRTKAHNTREGC